MAALAHVAVGFASRPSSRKVPVGILILAAEFLDILAIAFVILGIEKTGYIPWSHGLFMSAVWSVIVATSASLIYRSYRAGLYVGSLVFSHWLIDFVTHPMGAVFGGRPLPPDLPLLLAGSPQVGLGLYNYSLIAAYAIEYGTLAVGVVIYVVHTVNNRRTRQAANGPRQSLSHNNQGGSVGTGRP